MTGPRRIIFVNRFYFPDHSATAQILTDLAEGLSARGWRVEIVTSRLRYDDPSAILSSIETYRGVTIRRVPTTRFGRASLLGRGGDYLSFYVSAFWALARLARRDDLVVAKTDPPLLSVVVGVVTKLRRARLINWLQDLYPEVAAELGVGAMRGWLGGVLKRLRNRSLRKATLNVAIGERMAERLRAQDVPSDQIVVMPNWCDDDAIMQMPRTSRGLRTEWDLGDRFVVCYSGNLGRAHEAETMLGAARLLRDCDDLVFLMIGGGHESAALAAQVAAEGLDRRVRFQPYQPRERLNETLGVADMHWLSLRPALEGLIVPSKFYGIAAAGRGVIAVTDVDGELARVIVREQCGLVIAPGDSVGLAAAVTALAADSAQAERMGIAARALLERDYRRADTIARWDALLRQIA